MPTKKRPREADEPVVDIASLVVDNRFSFRRTKARIAHEAHSKNGKSQEVTLYRKREAVPAKLVSMSMGFSVHLLRLGK
jgi:hypothetical protein